MKKTYFLKIFICLFLFLAGMSYAQSQTPKIEQKQTTQIENLSIYPNPVTSGTVIITTKFNLSKQIEIYDVLGKKVMSTVLQGKELQVSDLNSGVYILKIRERNSSATRKLVIR